MKSALDSISEKIDWLDQADLGTVIRYGFLLYRGDGANVPLMRSLILKINAHLKRPFFPSRDDLKYWVEAVLKDIENDDYRRSIVLIMVCNFKKENQVYYLDLIKFIDELIEKKMEVEA